MANLLVRFACLDFIKPMRIEIVLCIRFYTVRGRNKRFANVLSRTTYPSCLPVTCFPQDLPFHNGEALTIVQPAEVRVGMQEEGHRDPSCA